MSKIHELSAVELAVAVRDHALSPTEIVEHFLLRIADRGDELGAYLTVCAELAREQAAEAERATFAAGDVRELPALHGVPMSIKDLTAVAGIRTTYGSCAYRDFVPDRDDDVVARLRAAGVVILGKSNTPEFGLPCYTENGLAPPARTPWDLTRSAGGSSGGAAAGVAAGLAPVAHGTDGGGSIRIPASACGLVGLKPSRGLTGGGARAFDPLGLVGHGVLARTVEDAASLLDAMADPGAAPAPPGFLGHARREPGRLRVALHAEPAHSVAHVDPECRAATVATAELLTELGHDVEEVAAPMPVEFMEHFATVWTATTPLTAVPPGRGDDLAPLTRWLRARGERTGARQLLEAWARLDELAQRALTATADYDVVLTPTLAALPAPVGYFHDRPPADNFARQCAFTPFCSVYNVTGQPALSLPLWWTEGGLPVGVMFAGRPKDEATLLALGAQLETARPWRDRRSPLDVFEEAYAEH